VSSDKTTVLVIEDEAPIRCFLRAYLESQDFRLVEAESGEEGIGLAASHQPALILLDLGLPGMDGLEVIRRIRQWTATPILVLSARGKEQDKIDALDAGADDYLIKPFGVGELSARMRVALRHSALAAQADRVGGGPAADPVFRCGELCVDLAARHVVQGLPDGFAGHQLGGDELPELGLGEGFLGVAACGHGGRVANGDALHARLGQVGQALQSQGGIGGLDEHQAVLDEIHAGAGGQKSLGGGLVHGFLISGGEHVHRRAAFNLPQQRTGGREIGGDGGAGVGLFKGRFDGFEGIGEAGGGGHGEVGGAGQGRGKAQGQRQGEGAGGLVQGQKRCVHGASWGCGVCGEIGRSRRACRSVAGPGTNTSPPLRSTHPGHEREFFRVVRLCHLPCAACLPLAFPPQVEEKKTRGARRFHRRTHAPDIIRGAATAAVRGLSAHRRAALAPQGAHRHAHPACWRARRGRAHRPAA